jgi:hypothetical protein
MQKDRKKNSTKSGRNKNYLSKSKFKKKRRRIIVDIVCPELDSKIDANCRKSKLFEFEILKNYRNLHMPSERSLIKISKKTL